MARQACSALTEAGSALTEAALSGAKIHFALVFTVPQSIGAPRSAVAESASFIHCFRRLRSSQNRQVLSLCSTEYRADPG